MGMFATVRHSLRVLWRAARELFHEVTGTLFFLIAVSAIQFRMARLAPRRGPVDGGLERGIWGAYDSVSASYPSAIRGVCDEPSSRLCPVANNCQEASAGIGERKKQFATLGGIPLKAVFTQEDLAAETPKSSGEPSIGVPGEFPYTRGIYPTMYRGRLWTMRQYAGFGTAAQSNERYRYLLAKGQTDCPSRSICPRKSASIPIILALGRRSRQGRRSHRFARGHGNAVRQYSAGTRLDFDDHQFDGRDFARAVRGRREKAGRESGEACRDGAERYFEGVHRARHVYLSAATGDAHRYRSYLRGAARNCRRGIRFRFPGYHIREAGSTAAQEIAFTLADAIAYVDAAIAAGQAVDEFAPRLSFFFNAHNDLLEEIAKYRAARRLWAHLMRERFGARNPASMMLRFHAQTAGSSLTAQQPENNIVRVAIQALGAVLGGCQSLHTNSMDEALALPTEDAALLALRTQQIIAHETGVANTVDPAGGSYAIEKLTDEIESRARNYIAKIDALGGMLRAIETGYVQGEIQKAAYEYQRAIERGEQIVVGVNQFVAEKEIAIPTLRIDPDIERAQVERVRHCARAAIPRGPPQRSRKSSAARVPEKI